MAKIVINRTQQTGKYYREDLGNKVELEMMLIPAGSFVMGAPETEESSSDEERPQHEVTLPTFFMGRYPVTQAQWKAVAALPQVNKELETDPSHFKGDNRPVECVSWYDAVEFCDRLSSYTKRQYRLPSEAEWEYACRAGTTTPFHFGETITTDLANYDGTDDKDGKWSGSYGRGSKGIYRKETTVVGSFAVANAFGLCDMHGNVWEWCLDDWHDNYEGAPTDGSPWFGNDNNNYFQKQGIAVLRGGSWRNNPIYCRSAFRIYNFRDLLNYGIGFRVVCAFGRTSQ
jgi:formylglycine-generating enzyme required for sulfatase activity